MGKISIFQMNKKIFLLGIIVVTFMMLTSTVIAASVDAKGSNAKSRCSRKTRFLLF